MHVCVSSNVPRTRIARSILHSAASFCNRSRRLATLDPNHGRLLYFRGSFPCIANLVNLCSPSRRNGNTPAHAQREHLYNLSKQVCSGDLLLPLGDARPRNVLLRMSFCGFRPHRAILGPGNGFWSNSTRLTLGDLGILRLVLSKSLLRKIFSGIFTIYRILNVILSNKTYISRGISADFQKHAGCM